MIVKQRNLSAMILSKAVLDLGLSEIPGGESNPRIDAMFRRFGMDCRDETAWCGVYMGDVVARCMEPPGSELSDGLTAEMMEVAKIHLVSNLELAMHAVIERLYIRRGAIVIPENPEWALNWRNFGQGVGSILSAQPGDVCVFRRGEGGHVALFVSFHTKGATVNKISVLGGNQSNSVCIKAYPASRLLAVRRAVIAKP